MKKIEWKPKNSRKYANATIGCVTMYCNVLYITRRNKTKFRWCADVSVGKPIGTFTIGPLRKSMAEAKKDAVQLARKLLLDYHACLKIEMANFDLVG